MDRDTFLAVESGQVRTQGPVLPSRRTALNRLLPALRSGPVLISGEAGSGKSWLARALAEEVGPGLNWVEIDIAPAMTSADFFGWIASGLQLDPQSDRFSIASALTESSTDGKRWALRVDEAQNASLDILEEIRLLDNHLGRADGFESIVLVAQTSLARRLDLRAFAGLETRLAAHVHLTPIDADEAEILLEPLPLETDLAEALHRSAMGNPARLLRLARAASPISLSMRESPSQSRAEINRESITGPILPSRPPLRVEDGVVEVGWDSELEPSAIGDENAPAEPIRDPYAALQAEAEWARVRNLADLEAEAELGDEDGLDDEMAETEENPQIRAEGQQEFAPYSQLFARLKTSAEVKDAERPI